MFVEVVVAAEAAPDPTAEELAPVLVAVAVRVAKVATAKAVPQSTAAADADPQPTASAEAAPEAVVEAPATSTSAAVASPAAAAQ